VNACIDPTLLWPAEDEPSFQVPRWPSLQSHQIELPSTAPSGQSYFERLRDYGEDNTLLLHGVNSGTMNLLVSALAMAVRAMPVLERLIVECKLEDTYEFINYYGPGWEAEGRHMQGLDKGSRRIVCDVGTEWQMERHVVEGLMQAGKERPGEDVVESFLPLYDGSG
jgi:hypothetical protein